MTAAVPIVPDMDPRLRAIAAYFLGCEDRGHVDPVAIGADLLPLVYVLKIENSAESGQTRLRIGLTGTKIDEALNRGTRGRCLEDFLHGPRARDVVAKFHDCVVTKNPFWMRHVGRIRDGAPRFVEGVGVYLAPGYIYGGLMMGEFVTPITAEVAFQHRCLRDAAVVKDRCGGVAPSPIR